jgi:hypothetical protein
VACHPFGQFAETAAVIVEFRETRIMPAPRGAGVRTHKPAPFDQLTGGAASVQREPGGHDPDRPVSTLDVGAARAAQSGSAASLGQTIANRSNTVRI